MGGPISMKASDANSPLEELRGKLAEARLQALNLEEEITRLEKRGQLELPSAPAVQKTPQSPAEKAALFPDLFGREFRVRHCHSLKFCAQLLDAVKVGETQTVSPALSSSVTSCQNDEMAARAGIEPATK
jgi:hypothetical protein